MKKILLILILVFMPISIQAQDSSVVIQYQTGQDFEGDSLFINIQVATDQSFNIIMCETGWKYCLPNTLVSYTCILPYETQTYYHRGRHKDQFGYLSDWSEVWNFTFQISNQPPSGCNPISPPNGEIIVR